MTVDETSARTEDLQRQWYRADQWGRTYLRRGELGKHDSAYARAERLRREVAALRTLLVKEADDDRG